MPKAKNKSDKEQEPAIVTKSQEDLGILEKKYNQLINEIKPHLLTKAQLKQGGGYVRSQYEKEKGYEAIIPEINEIGKELGRPKIGLGNLRR